MRRSPLIADKDFYILKFKDEPVIKIGRTGKIYSRIENLSRGYNGGFFTEQIFDYSACYLIEAPYNYCITDIETEIKQEFQDYRCLPSLPWKLGNGCIMPAAGMHYTETFQSFITRNILDSIKRRMKKWHLPYSVRTGSILFDSWEYWNTYGYAHWEILAPEIPL
jgi:hypothetical protein